MAESTSGKTGALLITGLILAVLIFAALITRDIYFPKDNNPPLERRKQESMPPPAPEAPGPETVLSFTSEAKMKRPDTTPQQDLLAHQLNNEGITSYTRGNYSEAAGLFQKAYDRNTQNGAIRDNLVHSLESLAWKQTDARQYLDALLNFQRAIQLKSDESMLYLGQGLVYHRLNDSDRAIESLKQAIALDPRMPEAYKIFGRIYYERDEIEMAIGYYEKGLELDPSDKALMRQLAKARREETVQTGFQQEASRAFTVKFEGREERETARRVLHDLEEAYRKIGQAISHYPQQPITVILYTNQQFRDVTRTPAWTKGLFDGKIRVPVAGAAQNPVLLKKVLFHEYTHAVIFELSRGLTVPHWLNEGIAEYFEDQADSHSPSSPDPGLHRYFRSGQRLVPLSQLHGSFMGLSTTQASLAYAESYSAVLTLIDRFGLFRIKQVFEELGEGKDFASAFSDRFMISYAQFQSDWERQVEGAAQ